MEGGVISVLSTITLEYCSEQASIVYMIAQSESWTRASKYEREKKAACERNCDTDTRIHKEKKLKRCTVERSSLSPVHRNRGISPWIGPFLDLGPRRIFLLLHERLSALHTVPRNLRYKIINKKTRGVYIKKNGNDKTHMAVLLASVARLDGRLGAIHIFRDGIRRSQTVPALRRYQFKQHTGR